MPEPRPSREPGRNSQPGQWRRVKRAVPAGLWGFYCPRRSCKGLLAIWNETPDPQGKTGPPALIRGYVAVDDTHRRYRWSNEDSQKPAIEHSLLRSILKAYEEVSGMVGLLKDADLHADMGLGYWPTLPALIHCRCGEAVVLADTPRDSG